MKLKEALLYSALAGVVCGGVYYTQFADTGEPVAAQPVERSAINETLAEYHDTGEPVLEHKSTGELLPEQANTGSVLPVHSDTGEPLVTE